MNRRVTCWVRSALSVAAWTAATAALTCGPSLLGAQPATTNRFKDSLVFANGDRIGGRLQGLQPDGWLSWQHPDSEQAMTFATKNLAQIDLEGRGGDPTDGAAWKVRFENDDELSVRKISITGQEVELEGWYCGTVKVPRQRIKNLFPVQTHFATLFEGPQGTNGWTSWKVVSALGEPGEWKYQNGAFYAKEAASIARSLNLPDSFTMEFDLKWKGPLNVAIAVFTDSLKPISLANKEDEPDFAGFYSLQINSFGANLLSVKKRDPLRYLGQQAIAGFGSKTKAHVEIKADKRSRRILLFVDGVVVKQWLEPSEFSGEGKGIRLVHQGQGSVRFSGLKVTEWDGRYEDRVPAGTTAQAGDIVLTLDGERLVGRIRSIEGGNLILTDETGEKVKPVKQIRAVELRGAVAAPGTTPVSPVGPAAAGSTEGLETQTFLQKHGRLTLRLTQIQGGKLKGTAAMLGPIELDASAVGRVQVIQK